MRSVSEKEKEITTFDINEHINRFQNYGPEYGESMLSNHLPMALYALHRMGADEADITRFTDRYTRIHRLTPMSNSADAEIAGEDWRNTLGTHQRYPAYRSFFADRLQKLGREKFLKIYFNPLIPGISAAAYHALIRLAYGVESQNDEEILSGMAYMADSHLELQGPLPDVSDNGLSIKEQMSFVSQELSSGRLVLPALEGVISEKMDTLSQGDVLGGIAENLTLSVGVTLRDFAAVALDLYLTTKNFTALHTVTGCHAARVLQPYVEDEILYLRYFHQAFVAAYLSIGAPPIKTQETKNDAGQIEKIKTAARKASNDHDIKLTYTVLEEYKKYGSALYLRAAAEFYHAGSS